MKIRKVIRDSKILLPLIAFQYRLFGLNSIKRRSQVSIFWKGAFVKKSRFRIKGTGNKIIIEDGCRLNECKFTVLGNNNVIHISKDCVANNLEIWLQNDGNEFFVGCNTWFNGYSHFACIEGTKISVGERCLFSSDVTFRTGDSHSILDLHNNRINPSLDISIGNHVWIGNRVKVLKGVEILDNSIIGTGSIVTKKKFEKNTLLAGIPAKMIRKDINWHHENL